MKSKKVLIIGGGMAGCAAANILSDIDYLKIDLVEKLPFLGAGVRTFLYAGVYPYTFGPRHFLSSNKKVYDYFNSIVKMRSVRNHEFITYSETDDSFLHYPITLQDINKMKEKKKIKKEISISKFKIKKSKNLEEYWISSVGKTIYNKIIKNYNHKMWMVNDNKKIDTFNWSPKGATILNKKNDTAWSEIFSSYPIKKNGYNDYFDRVFKTKTNVFLNSNLKILDINKKEFFINNKKFKYDIVINTVSPDFLLDYHYGELKYIGRDMHYIVFPIPKVFPNNISFVYYANKEKFTRMVEYNKFTNFKHKHSLIGLEYPSLNGKYYPLPFKSEIKKSMKYLNNLPEWYFSIGRAGTYRYAVDIDDSIEQALEIKKIILKNNYFGSMPLKKWMNPDQYDNNKK
jgi:UDP-galactopyranose mutase